MIVAVEKCRVLDQNSYEACSSAVTDVHKQIIRFLELDVKLVKYIDQLKKCVSDSELKAIYSEK